MGTPPREGMVGTLENASGPACPLLLRREAASASVNQLAVGPWWPRLTSVVCIAAPPVGRPVSCGRRWSPWPRLAARWPSSEAANGQPAGCPQESDCEARSACWTLRRGSRLADSGMHVIPMAAFQSPGVRFRRRVFSVFAAPWPTHAVRLTLPVPYTRAATSTKGDSPSSGRDPRDDQWPTHSFVLSGLLGTFDPNCGTCSGFGVFHVKHREGGANAGIVVVRPRDALKHRTGARRRSA